MTGLVITKTKSQRGLLEPVTRIRKPYSIQEEMGEERGPGGRGADSVALVRDRPGIKSPNPPEVQSPVQLDSDRWKRGRKGVRGRP